MNPGALAVIPVVLAGVLLVSGISKMGDTAGTLATMKALRVPLVSNSRFVAIAAPWIEIAVAVALLVLPGWGFVAAGIAAALLMLWFTALVAVALLRGEEVDCNCFGALSTEPIGVGAFVRNIVLLAASVLVALGFSGTAGVIPSLQGFDRDQLTWFVALLVVAVAFGLLWASNRRLAARAPQQAVVRPTEGPRPIPDAELVDADGETHTLSSLVNGKAVLLLFARLDCAACAQAVEAFPGWRDAIGSSIDIVVATSASPKKFAEAYPALAPLAMYGYRGARDALGIVGVPAAVLLGTDRMVAAGPEYGPEAIDDLVGGIAEALALNAKNSVE